MSPFHVNYRTRLAEVTAQLSLAQQENRKEDAIALELAARLLERHVIEIETRQPALV